MTKLIGPVDINNLSVAGINYEVVEGIVDVEPAHVADLIGSYGFDFYSETAAVAEIDPFETMTRTQMFDYLRAAGVAVMVNSKNEVLRDICRQTAADKVKADALAEANAIADKAAADKAAADKVIADAEAESQRIADEVAAEAAAKIEANRIAADKAAAEAAALAAATVTPAPGETPAGGTAGAPATPAVPSTAGPAA